MTQKPYERFSEKELILRDHLAVDRTTLANERTVLAYIRTAMIFVVASVTIIKLFPNEKSSWVIGVVFGLCAIVMFAIGFLRFFRQQKVLSRLK